MRIPSDPATDSDGNPATHSEVKAAVLGREIGELELVRARRRRKIPVVLTREEVRAVLDHLEGVPKLFCLLLYGTGLRLMEGLRLRVKDVDFSLGEILVRDGKGEKDRRTMLPPAGPQGPAREGGCTAPPRPCRGLRARLPALCAGPEVLQGRVRLVLAVCLPRRGSISRTAQRAMDEAPCLREKYPARVPGGDLRRGDHQTLPSGK